MTRTMQRRRGAAARTSGRQNGLFRDSIGSDDALEVFDAKGKPLMLMPGEFARRQLLRCRAAQVAIMDRDGRVLLAKYTKQHATYPGLWDISASGYLRPGESFLDAALRTVANRFVHPDGDLAFVTIIPASPATRNLDIALFRNRHGTFFPQLRPEGEIRHTMLVDEEELAALIREMPELVTPGLRMASEYMFQNIRARKTA